MQALTTFLRAIGKSRLLGELIYIVQVGLRSLFSLPTLGLIIGAKEMTMDFFPRIHVEK